MIVQQEGLACPLIFCDPCWPAKFSQNNRVLLKYNNGYYYLFRTFGNKTIKTRSKFSNVRVYFYYSD